MAQKITFTLSADIVYNATSGILLGDFNNWDLDNGIELKKQKDGSLKTTISLETGKTYQYRYFLNDGRWVNDSNADAYAYAHEFFIDNCVITVSEKIEAPIKAEKTEAPVLVEAPLVVAKKVAKAKKETVAEVVAPVVAEKKTTEPKAKKVAVVEVVAEPLKTKKATK